MSRLLVALQFVLIAGIVARVDLARFGPAGVALLALGLVLGLWTITANRPGNFNIRPEPKQGGHLVVHGPYRWIRHPMYGAVLLAMIAFALGGDALQWGLWTALLCVLVAKAAREERFLALAYPAYADYRSRTRAIVPFLL